jgi:sucrose-6-phosphate hydrolase SacC (GH32 family)
VDWTYESRVEQDKWGDELCGCVDFFTLPIDGNEEDRKWVMVFIDGSYIAGTFDGHTFYTLQGKPASMQDRVGSLIPGGNFYATMTWHNMPDGRRVQITWMANEGQHHDMPFSQQMTLPSELTLHATQDGPRLRLNPITELETLRTHTEHWHDLELDSTTNPLSRLNGELYEIEIELTPGKKSRTEIHLRGIQICYNAETKELSCKDVTCILEPENGLICLQIFVDRASIEIYANHGRVYVPLIHAMPVDNRSYSISVTGGECHVHALQVHKLEAIWPPTTSTLKG